MPRRHSARKTFFVTNGTSTANQDSWLKLLVQPGDIVLVDRNCHQSHHYGLMMSGAHVHLSDAYPAQLVRDRTGPRFAGEIKRVLLQFRTAEQVGPSGRC